MPVTIRCPNADCAKRIELSEPAADLEVKVDGDVIDVVGLKEPLRLTAGEHHLLVTSGDYQSVSKSFTVRRGEEQVLHVTLEPKPKEPHEPAEPSPAVYAVAVDPPDAEVTARGEGVAVEGTGAARTITVAEPDGRTKVTVVASLAGHETVERELQPQPGEVGRLTLRLRAPPAPPPEPEEPVEPPPAVAPSDVKQVGDKEIAIDLGDGVNLEMVLIPAGEFMMGSPDSDPDAGDDEKPQHRVRITRPFYLGKYPVTQEQWEAVMGSNPSNIKGPENPVEMVSWNECQRFVQRLNERLDDAVGEFRLPTEAEWEYACRARTTTRYSFGDDAEQLGEYAWYGDNSDGRTHPVGQKRPNPWGLYDMHGNVWEWCADRYDSGYYGNSPVDDPTGPASGYRRVSRGGSQISRAGSCRSASRFRPAPGIRHVHLGFRVALVPADESSK